MSGSRTTTGCYTCRLRRKKCDESRPICLNCSSREIHCYGYGTRPAWMTGMRYWRDVLASDQARAIRESAEKSHKRRRRTHAPASLLQHTSNASPPQSTTNRPLVLGQTLSGPSVTGGSLWSDGSGLLTGYRHLPHFPLVVTFLDVIFPLQYGFYDIDGQSDRTWLSNAILETKPLYHASLALCISFLSGAKTGNTSGLCQNTPDVRRLQLHAIQGLQPRINELGEHEVVGEQFLVKVIQAISIVLHLLSLEIYAPVEGAWQVHLKAAKTLLDMVETKWVPTPSNAPRGLGTIGEVLSNSTASGPRKSLDFFLSSYVWVDIMAEATHGHQIPVLPEFDYLSLLRRGLIDLRKTMGCHTQVMTAIREVTLFDAWLGVSPESEPGTWNVEKQVRSRSLELKVEGCIKELEPGLCSPPTNLKTDSGWVTVIHAYAALVYLHTISLGPIPDRAAIRKYVTRCLETLESLPTRLFIRVCWPYTIAGCMADGDQHPRYRALIARVEAEAQVLGFTWKGLLVMEECWRLRRCTNAVWYWRNTMEHMDLKILLI